MANDWPSTQAYDQPPGAGSAGGAYGRALRNHAVIAVAIFVVIVAAAAGFAFARPRPYQATARILVNPLPQDDTDYIGLPLIRDSGDPTRTMETAATLIDSSQAAHATAAVLGRGWTESRVQQAVNVQPEGQSNILDVTATASHPALASTLANTFANSALAIRTRQLERVVAAAIAADQAQLAAIPDPSSAAAATINAGLGNLRLVASGGDPTISFSQPALTPRSPSGLSPPLLILVGVIVGAAIASVVVLVIELARPRRIGQEGELVAALPAPVLGRMPFLRRGLRSREGSLSRWPPAVGEAVRSVGIRLDSTAGPRGLRPRDGSLSRRPPAVIEALRSVRIQLDLMGGRRRTILVTSPSGGDGKTTVSVNLARELARSGARVLIIDADLRKPDVGGRLSVEPAAPLAEVLESVDIASFARAAPGVPTLQVIAASPDPEFETLDRVAAALSAALERALEAVDYVIVDAPPLGEVADVLRFIRSVDDVLVVSRLGHTLIGRVEVTRELLDLAGRAPTGHVVIGAGPRHAPGYDYTDNSRAADRPTAPEPSAKDETASDREPVHPESSVGSDPR